MIVVVDSRCGLVLPRVSVVRHAPPRNLLASMGEYSATMSFLFRDCGKEFAGPRHRAVQQSARQDEN
jgi:hypothetical protein